VSKFFYDPSPVHPPGPTPIWPSKVRQHASLPVRFDSGSYPIGVDSQALECMANKAHLFEDLRLNKDKGQVDGIIDGLAIAGKGTFKFIIKDDEGK
jgi:hypothetical protein